MLPVITSAAKNRPVNSEATRAASPRATFTESEKASTSDSTCPGVNPKHLRKKRKVGRRKRKVLGHYSLGAIVLLIPHFCTPAGFLVHIVHQATNKRDAEQRHRIQRRIESRKGGVGMHNLLRRGYSLADHIFGIPAASPTSWE